MAQRAVADHAHHHGAGVPARRDEAADGRGLGGLLVGVHRLRIEGAAEGDDLVPGDGLAPERDRLADLDVLVVHLVGGREPGGMIVLHAANLFPLRGSKLFTA